MAIYNYVRVSTEDQDFGRQLQLFAEEGECIEEKRSGRDALLNPKLNALIEKLQPGDIVRAAAVDRIARSVMGAHSIVQRITERGATLEITNQGLVFAPDCSSNPIQKMTFTMLAAFAELERNTIRERQAQGYAAIRAGLRKNRGNRRFHSQQTVKAVLDDVLGNGLSYRRAGEKNGVPASTVQCWVERTRAARQ